MSTKRFRIAFSFAGEKRDFVAKVAAPLAARFGSDKILYDKYHEAEFARRDLGIYLPELYHKNSDLVVVVVCPAYDEKEWTGLEWTAIHDLLKHREDNEVMLCRFEHAEVAGLYSTAGFIELDEKTPEEAAALILERLALNEGKPKNHYGTDSTTSARPARTTIPNNLPRLQSFFGRAEELKQITDALDPESRTWGALIDGPGGMGKTSLAVRAAYDCEPDQFQRIIFVSVKDREMDEDGERTLGNLLVPGFLEMLNEIARELGQPDIAKSAEDQRIRLLLDALRPVQALLILDNLESIPKSDRDQLFNFVKRLPQGCKAILTSRRRIGSGSELVQLDILDQDAALATLAELAEHNRLLAKTSEAERGTLWKQTGGNPLLLRWVAGQLGRGSCRTFTDALHFLSTCPPENDPLEFIFGDLADEFTDLETKILCALSYFTLPVSVKHIAVVANPLSDDEREVVEFEFETVDENSKSETKVEGEGPQQRLSDAEVETALDSLANRSLVVPDQEEKQYALVPMVAEFLRKHRPEVVRETGSRLEQRAYALIVENGYQKHARFSVLDAAWPTVAPALPLFLAGPNPRLQSVCDALSNFLNFTGRWDERLLLNQQAEARAVAAGDRNYAGWRSYDAGVIYDQRRQADAVVTCADRAAEHWETAKAGARERAAAISLRGKGHQLKYNHEAALAAFREALDLDRSLSAESVDVAIDLNDVAYAEHYSGDLTSAERDYREALQVARAVSYAEGVASYTGNVAALAMDRKDWPKAETLLREALPLSEKVGRQELIAADCYRLAKSLLRQRKFDEALPHAHRAVELYEKLASHELAGAEAILQEVYECLRPRSET